jgi:hypothetical protein
MDDFDTKSVWKIIFWIIGVVVALTIILGLIGLPLGWFDAILHKASPQNVEVQYTYGYDHLTAMRGITGNVCQFETVATQAAGTADSGQRLTQLMQEQSLYRMREQEYDSWAANIFTGKIVHPADLPNTAPTLDEMKTQICK